jgi:hypothetical protein
VPSRQLRAAAQGLIEVTALRDNVPVDTRS